MNQQELEWVQQAVKESHVTLCDCVKYLCGCRFDKEPCEECKGERSLIEQAILRHLPEERLASSTQGQLSDEQIKHMVNRFLAWRLPENFNPDGGISFKRMFNEHTTHPMKAEPVGTNLFDYTQAEAMVRHMIEGLAGVASSPQPAKVFFVCKDHQAVDCLTCNYLTNEKPAETGVASSPVTPQREQIVERIAKFIVEKESRRYKTLDEALYHQSKWKRVIPEAEEMFDAIFGAEAGEPAPAPGWDRIEHWLFEYSNQWALDVNTTRLAEFLASKFRVPAPPKAKE